MSQVVLQSETTTALTRTTVHTKYEHRAFGLYILSRFIPFTFYVHAPVLRHVRAIIEFDNNAHIKPQHKDYGVVEKKYQRVYTFNIRHYLQCYLPNAIGNDGEVTEPFTYNLCVRCGASLSDGYNRLVSEMIHRTYRPDKFIWQAAKTLQDTNGANEVFTPREGVL